MPLRILLASAALAALSGCISIGADPPDALLTLTPSTAVPSDRVARAAAGEAITILPPSLPAALTTTRVPVQVTPTQIAYVKDAQWVDQPNRMFQRLLSETVQAKGGRTVLDPRQFAFDPGLRLSGQLLQFGVDAARSEAVVVFEAALLRGGALETRRFEARAPVAEIAAAPVGEALNEAANRVAADVAGWIG